MRFSRLMLAASGLATVALLASSAVANAATINGPIFNKAEAGYQIQSSVPFNEVRTTIHIPAGSESSSFIDLAEGVNGVEENQVAASLISSSVNPLANPAMVAVLVFLGSEVFRWPVRNSVSCCTM